MKRLSICAFFLAAMSVNGARAQTVLQVTATPASLSTTEDTEKLDYLILDLPTIEAPEGMLLEEAILNLYMDASSTRDAETPAGETVTLEVYPYKGISKAGIDPSQIGTSAMKRTVRVGTGKAIKVYVTDFVVGFIADPASSRRLVVGSVSGDRDAIFEAKTIPGMSNAKATLTVYFSRIEDASAVQGD